MKTTILLLLSGLVVLGSTLAADVPSPSDQIALAVMGAPQESQSGAGVWGFDQSGKLVKLREATNDFVCFGDAPFLKGIGVDCAPKALEYWMVREWELRSQGKRPFDTLWPEVESGRLKKPPAQWTLHLLRGSSFDASTGRVADYKLRWVVRVPNATPGALGLSAEHSDDKPWLMNAGEPGAHIMIPGVTEQP